MHKIIKDVAISAVSNLDKATILRLASGAAGTVSRAAGQSTLAKLAGVISTGLDVYANVSEQETPARPSSPEPASNGDGAPQGWQKALQLLQSRSTESEGRQAVPVPKQPAHRPPTEAGTGRRAARGILSGAYDTANIGSFALSLYNGQQLSVSQLRAPGNIGGNFWLGELPTGTWVRLKDRGDRLLPVWISINGHDVDVQVGGGPEDAPIVSPVDILPSVG
jgi:hypothetical protein